MEIVISILVAPNTFGDVLGDANSAWLDVGVSIQDTLRLFLFGFPGVSPCEECKRFAYSLSWLSSLYSIRLSKYIRIL